MNVQLQKTELEGYIQEQVICGPFSVCRSRGGRCPTPRMAEDQMELTDEDVAAIKLSDEQFARGEGIDAEEVKKQIRRLYGKAQP